jgi:hypothetical protein
MTEEFDALEKADVRWHLEVKFTPKIGKVAIYILKVSIPSISTLEIATQITVTFDWLQANQYALPDFPFYSYVDEADVPPLVSDELKKSMLIKSQSLATLSADVLSRWLELATAEFVTVRMPGTNEIAFRFCPQTLTVEVQRRGVKHYFPLATLCQQNLTGA